MQTYTSLKASISSWMARDDFTDANLDDFIDIAEAKVATRLRLTAQETSFTGTLTAGASSVLLPSDFLELRAIYRDGSPQRPLEYVTPEQLNNVANTTRAPNLYSIVGSGGDKYLTFAGPSDNGYTLIGKYYARFTALSGSNTSTWLTTNYPFVMLSAACVAASQFIMDDAKEQAWANRFEAECTALEASDESGKYGPVPTMRSERAAW